MSVHLIRGLIAAVPAFILGASSEPKFAVTLAAIAGIAVSAFSLIATSFSPLTAGMCMGALIGAFVGLGESGRSNHNDNTLVALFAGAVIGGVIGFGVVGFCQVVGSVLGSLKVTGWTIVNGKFVPIFAAS